MRTIAVFLALIVLIACQPVIIPQQNLTVSECKPPYYEYEPGDCCLDSEPNQICDRYENRTLPRINKTIIPQMPPGSHISDALLKLRQNITSYSAFKGKTQYLVRGQLARVKLEKIERPSIKINNTIPVAITDIYIDRASKEAVGYCDPRREKEIMGEFDPDRSACAKLIDVPISLPYDQYNPYLPEDWLTRFSHAQPILAETTDQYIREPTGWRLVNPVLHFQEGPSIVILRLDSKTGLPIKIEIKEGEKTDVISYNWLIHNMVKPEEVVYQKFHK
ncbi:MAG: hypothetical protein QXT19_02540 [Candidatus Woesearchaeota archaeon]